MFPQQMVAKRAPNYYLKPKKKKKKGSGYREVKNTFFTKIDECRVVL